MMVVGLKAEDHVKRAEITALRHGHTLLQRYERQFYTQKRLLGVIDPTNYLSCIIDSSTQYAYNVPYAQQSFKGLDTKNCLGQSLTAVHFHGRKLFVYPHAKYIAGGSNWTLHCLSSSLVQLAKDNGDKPLPKTLFIQMDNAAGENKNKYVFGFLSNLVAKGVFETIVVSQLLTCRPYP